MEQAAEESIPLSHEFVVDEEYQRTLIRAIFGSAFRPWLVVPVLGFLALLLVIGVLSDNLSFRIFVGLWIVVMAALVLVRYRRVRGTLRRAFPVGMVIRSGFGAQQFVISNGDDTSRLAYSGFDRVERRGALLWMRRRVPRRRIIYPGALFPESELARFANPAGVS